jgi:uncharacterized membrane protein YheB (UPF0754 family)
MNSISELFLDNAHLLVLPLIGAVIGYVTNFLAVKMLFWPKEPCIVMNRLMPFTPGVFFSEKKELANSVARIIDDELIDFEEMANMILDGTPIKDLETFRSVAKQLLVSNVKDLGLGKIAARKILFFDDSKMKDLILSAMGSKLKHIELLGGAIGFMIGAVQMIYVVAAS